MAMQQQTKTKGPDLKALGLNSAQEVFDLLALLKIDGEPIIKEDRQLLDPKEKAKAVFDYFYNEYEVEPEDLPYIASLIKKDLKSGKIAWRKG
ncbi:MAG: hypothetical protein KJ732_03060 [Candidatus Margulisbacteria bacterium]|nr:hypothetical protein [Candidatus Margulisiibacteriota bacterium]